MKSINLFRYKMFPLLALALVFCADSFGQLRRNNIIDESRALARKSEANVVLINTDVMGNIMAKCIEHGIPEVQLVFTRLKMRDVDEYVANHPEGKGYEKELIGKMTVLIKIQGDNVTDDTFTDAPGNNALNKLMSSTGLIRVNKPYGDLPVIRKVVYLEVGTICPPPTSCN